MAEPGLYTIVKLMASLAGSVSSLPGGTAVPAVSLVSPDIAGYEFRVTGQDGARYGTILSGAPLRVDMDVVSKDFINAVIAAEDQRFLEHPGVDPYGSISAVFDTISGSTRGGSGIAQQMIKNSVVGNSHDLSRKGVEAMLAVRAVQAMGRKEVMRRYLQAAWFGRGRTGVMSAPKVWFGTTWNQITLAEAASLAAMLKGPGRYDPWRNPELVKSRRDAIITVMLEKGWVSARDAERAIASPVKAVAPSTDSGSDPWVNLAAGRELAQSGLSGTGEVLASIHPEWQRISQEHLAKAVHAISPVAAPVRVEAAELKALQALDEAAPLPAAHSARLPAWSAYATFALLSSEASGWSVLGPKGRITDLVIEHPHKTWKPSVGDLVTGFLDEQGVLQVRMKTSVEAAVVAIDPRTGETIATIGGIDGNLTWFDRTIARRQPGSAIKPFLYLAALDLGFDPQTALEDRSVTYRSGGQNWTPRNYDGRELGVVPMHTALARSLNIATVWLAERVGIDAMAKTAEAAGVYDEGQMVRVLPSALGASETTLERLVSGYGAIINDAMPRKKHIITALTPTGGTQAPTPRAPGPGPIASAAAAHAMIDMLRGVVTRGTASVAIDKAPVMLVGKTGTTQDHKDAWFIAMTPHIAIGVWIGRDDGKPLPGATTGGTNAAPVVAGILKDALAAGLIDENGFRDARFTAGTPWPPGNPVNLPVVSADFTTLEYGDRLIDEIIPDRNPVYDDAGGFWGSIDDQRTDPGRTRDVPQPYEVVPDLNQDILDFLRDDVWIGQY